MPPRCEELKASELAFALGATELIDQEMLLPVNSENPSLPRIVILADAVADGGTLGFERPATACNR